MPTDGSEYIRVIDGDLRVLVAFDPRKQDLAGASAGRYGEEFDWDSLNHDDIWWDGDMGCAPESGVAVVRAEVAPAVVEEMEAASIRVEVFRPERAFRIWEEITHVVFVPSGGRWIVARGWPADALCRDEDQ